MCSCTQATALVKDDLVPWLAGMRSCPPTLAAALLQPPVLHAVQSAGGLECWITHLQPLVIATWRAAHRPNGHETPVTCAARAALLDAAARWPLPVTLRHVVRPLLLLLGEHPSVALLMVDLGGVLGAGPALAHLVPALVELLLVDGGREEARDSCGALGLVPVCCGCVEVVCRVCCGCVKAVLWVCRGGVGCVVGVSRWCIGV